jgi:hypothetical protein
VTEYRGELRLRDGENLLWQCSPRPEPPKARNRAVLVSTILGEPAIEAHADGTGTISFPGGPTLRAIDHAQRVFEHVRRARRSAVDTSAE